jgi:hypothetical protein
MLAQVTSFYYNIEQMFGFVKRQYLFSRLLIIECLFDFTIDFHNARLVKENIMNKGQSLVLQGAFLGCLLLAAFGWIVTADAAGLQSPQDRNSASTIPPAGILPPMLEQLNNSPANANSEDDNQDIFAASIAYTPLDDASPADSQADEPPGNQTNDCLVSPSFPESILEWCELISRYADQNDLDPNLIAALILQESGGQHLAYSHSGAVGLMQVMPRDGIAEKFMCKNGPCFSSRPTINELQDPEFNIAYGTRMLAGLNNRFGNIRDALKSYGPMDVGYTYADKVLAIWERHAD